MHAQVDGGRLRQALSKRLFGRVVAANELVMVHVDGLALLVRITEVNTLDEEAREEALSYHCFRGLVTPETILWVTDGGAQPDVLQHAQCVCQHDKVLDDCVYWRSFLLRTSDHPSEACTLLCSRRRPQEWMRTAT